MQASHLSGSIPSTIADLEALTALRLDHNELTGTVPANVWQLPLLATLRLDSNNLGGPVAAVVGCGVRKLPSVACVVNVSNNELCGAMPTELRGFKPYSGKAVQSLYVVL